MTAFFNSSDQLLVWGANVLLQVTLVTAITLVIAASVRRNPAVRHCVLCSSLLLVLLSPAIALVMQLSGSSLLSVSLMHEAAASVADTTAPELPEETLSAETPSSPAPFQDFSGTRNPAGGLTDSRQAEPGTLNVVTSVSAPWEPIASREEAIAAPAAPQQTATWIGKTLRVAMPPLLFVWLTGAVSLLGRLAIGWGRFAAILRSARPNNNASLAESFEQVGRTLQVTRMPELVFSDRASGPFSAGLLRGRVVLPRGMVERVTGRQLRDIFIHEVAHIVRRDQVVVLLQNLAAAIFWLHPLARVLNRQLAEAREEVCDNWVLAATDATSYSRTLLRLVELVDTTRSLPEPVSLFTSCWKLERRVAGLLDERRSRVTRLTTRAKALGVALSLVMAVVVALGTMTLAVEQPATIDSAVPAETSNSTAKSKPPANATVIRGTILDPDGQPAPGAFVSVVASKYASDMQIGTELLAEDVADDAGCYELSLQGVSSKTYRSPWLFARTDRSGIAWRPLDLDAQQTTLDVSLQPQQLILVRLVDAEGQPAAQLPVTLSMISVAGAAYHPDKFLSFYGLTASPRAGLAPTKTDDHGLLTIANIAAGQGVDIRIPGGEKFASQLLILNTGKPETRGKHDGTFRDLVKNMKPGEVATLTLAPAQIFEGVVLLGDSDKPAANARITMWASNEGINSMASIEGQTDEAGRFRLNPRPGNRFGIHAYPPKGTPYQVRRLEDLRWSSSGESKNIEIRLDPAVLAHGTIVDAQTGQPLRYASVQYAPRANNPNLTDDILTGWQGIQKTDAAGKFTIGVLPGPGTLLVHAAQRNYILREVGWRELARGGPGGARRYAHAFVKIDPTAGEPLGALKIALQPGACVKGTLTDAEGKRIERALVISRLKIASHSPQWRGFSDESRSGRFEIEGLRDDEKYPVHFLDPENRLGATAMISTSNPSPTIVLKPCGSATARFVDPDGKPVAAGLSLGLHMVVTPGKSKYDYQAGRRGETLADEDSVVNIDRVNYQPSPTTNAKGEMTFPVLIPGARYRFINFDDGPRRVSSEFVAKSGETYDMGDIEVQIDE